MLISHDVKGAWAFGPVLLPWLSSWIGYCLGKSFCPLPNFYFCNSFSCYAHGTASCHFCHVGPLGLLPLFLGFLGPFTLSLPLIVPMSLLAFIFAMLAHWVYYLFSWVSSAHLLYLYLLLCPWACWLSFLPCWPIGFITSFLGLPRPIYSIFTSYCVHGLTSYHSCLVGLLNLLPCFYYFCHLYSFFLPSFLLLGFFCYWVFFKSKMGINNLLLW